MSERPEQEWTTRIRSDFGHRTAWITAALMDALFLAIWLGLQAGVDYISRRFPPRGIHFGLFVVFQVLFALTTLLPVCFFLITDGYRMFRQAQYLMREHKSDDEQT